MISWLFAGGLILIAMVAALASIVLEDRRARSASRTVTIEDTPDLVRFMSCDRYLSCDQCDALNDRYEFKRGVHTWTLTLLPCGHVQESPLLRIKMKGDGR